MPTELNTKDIEFSILYQTGDEISEAGVVQIHLARRLNFDPRHDSHPNHVNRGIKCIVMHHHSDSPTEFWDRLRRNIQRMNETVDGCNEAGACELRAIAHDELCKRLEALRAERTDDDTAVKSNHFELSGNSG